ncbi:MAG: 1-acyl-sn-glycerol-3-phosphate acyltransferase [Bdellovibrionota bacterium]
MSAIKILTNWFNRVELPFGFKELYENSPNAILVTQTRSIVLKAFLNSVAERTGWDGTNYLNNSNLEILENALNWTSFTELSSWEATTKEAEGLEFIPLSIFNLRGPLKRLPKHKLGFLDVIFLLCGHSVNSYILGNKLRIDKFDPFSKLRLERKLKVEFYKNQKVVRGTPFETIDTQSRTVLSGVNYQKEISVVSKRLGVSEKKLEKKAQKVFFEIAANPKAIIFRIAALLTRPLLSHLFSDIITKGTEHIAPTVRDNAAVMIPMHRSHFDYMIISSEIYDSRLNTPLTAAGVNLSFWPFGFFIRSLGGYFVKRDVKDRIYNIVLKRYISYLIKRGHLQKFYIEGGRSRTGKMRRPKIGLLSMFVEAYSRGLRKDIAFIPVSLTYENVVEDSAYGTENTGSAKVKEN